MDNFTSEDFALLDDVVLGFYYPENPLLGKLIFENEYCAIHERSEKPKPKQFGHSLGPGGDGIIFIGFQARSDFVKPIVICNHRFKTPDRERKFIYFGTVLDVLIDLVDLISIETCIYLLRQLEKYWYDYPRKKSDTESWYSVIRKLIRKIAYYNHNPSLLDDFKMDFPALAVCERPVNVQTRSKRAQALAWRKLHLPQIRLVQDSFYMFDYESIVDLCEKAGGFNVTRNASIDEQKLLFILKDAAKHVLNGFILDFPICLIIDNDSSVYNGTAHMTPNKSLAYNATGLKVRYTLQYIEIKKSLLTKNSFMEAFSTYSHELCHCFGGDTSLAFSQALTHVITLTIANADALNEFNQKWVATAPPPMMPVG
jgi:hypothetical protein